VAAGTLPVQYDEPMSALIDVPLSAYPSLITEKVRFSDTDLNGHVNNVVFPVFLEAGRVDVLYGRAADLMPPGTAFVSVRTEIDFHDEINWPGEVQVGTRVEKLGKSSITFRQALYQSGRLVADSASVIVLTDAAQRRSTELPERLRAVLSAFTGNPS
jgi:acyl-CoA thioester hydrolase